MAWDEWTRHDATALAAEVRAGRVTPRELAKAIKPKAFRPPAHWSHRGEMTK
jgi:hypothetical protein